jgi:peptide/nickel transport system permease protein
VSWTIAEEVVAEDAAPARPAGPGLARRLLRRRLAVACMAYLAVVATVAIVAPIVMPDVAKQYTGDLLAAKQGPSAAHILGTDSLGRDVLDRLLVGARPTMLGVVEALAITLLLGVPFGLAAGFFRGWIDTAVSWAADLTFSLPAIVIVIIVVSVFPQNLLAAMTALGIVMAPGLMRVVRAATLPIREELYVAAARVSGLSRPYIILRHVLPRIAGVVIVQASLLSAVALVVQSGLAFLNLLVAPPAPSWGGMVADGVNVLELQPWLIWPPGIAIAITVLALALLGDVVRDASTDAWSVSGAPPKRRTRRAKSVSSASTRTEPSSIDPGESLLAIERLHVSLAVSGRRVDVLDDVSFDIRPGEAVGVVGESGCGKTMTALSILGLLPSEGTVDAGRVMFAGRDLAAASEHEMRNIRGKEIGFISQEPMVSLDPAFRVGNQIAEAVRRHRAIDRRASQRVAIELMADVRLPDPVRTARRYPHELSGGMAQRVALARALAGEPRLLIADEPTTALDVTVQAEVLQLLRDLQRERGMSILLVTHDWGVVASVCDRAVVMYAGQVVERAPLVPIFDQPLHPYTRALLGANPHNSAGSSRLPTIAGTVPQPGAWPSGCRFCSRCGYATARCGEGPIPLVHVDPDRETRCIHHVRLLSTP